MRTASNYREFNGHSYDRNNGSYHKNSIKRIKNRRKRSKYVKCLKIASILAVLIIILTAAMVFFTPKNVKADETVYYKYFQFYKVEAGDTLWSLAKEYSVEGRKINDYIDEVVNSNHIKNNKIVEGEIIILPYYLTYIK